MSLDNPPTILAEEEIVWGHSWGGALSPDGVPQIYIRATNANGERIFVLVSTAISAIEAVLEQLRDPVRTVQ